VATFQLNKENDMIKFQYDTKQWCFREMVQTFLDFEDLAKIHEKHRFAERLQKGTDQNQPLHRKFYDAMVTQHLLRCTQTLSKK
jgi:hypothetical protein